VREIEIGKIRGIIAWIFKLIQGGYQYLFSRKNETTPSTPKIAAVRRNACAYLLSFTGKSRSPSINDPAAATKVIKPNMRKKPLPGKVSVANAAPRVAAPNSPVLISRIFLNNSILLIQL
jgi:hypothetical protein